jgi:hypothetical protein
LISPDFLTDRYCYDTVLHTALARHVRGEAIAIPVIIRPAPWRDVHILNNIQVFPRNGQPTSGQPDQENALWEVAEEIDKTIQQMREPSVRSNVPRSSGSSGLHTGTPPTIQTSPNGAPFPQAGRVPASPRRASTRAGILLNPWHPFASLEA